MRQEKSGQAERFDIFISYSSKDVALAQELYNQLIRQGFKVWFDKDRLKPGFDWHREIEAGCENSRIFLPILTPNWKISDWTKYETYSAECVIPLMYEGRWDEVFTPPLQRFQSEMVNLEGRDGAVWERLFDAIRNALKKPEGEKVERLAHVRDSRSPCFVGREKELTDIHESLFSKSTASLTQGRICAITATPGKGKTALAREYAEKFWRCYRQIFWVDCRPGCVYGLAAVFQALFPQESGQVFKDEERARRVLFEFQRPDAPLRLLIYDDVLDEESIADWLPNSGNVHAIITSVFTAWAPHIKPVPIWFLDPEPARVFLLKRAERDWDRMGRDDRAACEELAARLQFLPLALEHAAVFIKNEPADFRFRDYLDMIQDAARTRQAQVRLGGTAVKRMYPETVYETWFCTIKKLSPGARALLRLASFLSAAPIPLSLFAANRDAVVRVAREFDDRFGDMTGEEVRLFKAALASYSMITLEGDDCFSLEPSLQELELQQVGKEDWPKKVELVMDMLAAIAPFPAHRMENWPAWGLIAPHVRQVWRHIKADPGIRPNPGLLTGMAAYLNAKGRPAEAVELARMDVALREKADGKFSPAWCTSVDLLAAALCGVGEWSEAESCFKMALEGRQASRPPRHPETLASLNNLACLLALMDRHAEAIPLYRQSWEGCKANPDIGPDHRDAVNTAINLAAALRRVGQAGEAEALYEAMLPKCEAIGPGIQETLTCLNGLGVLLTAKGAHRQAEQHLRLAVKRAVPALGFDHPDTCAYQENLARLLAATARESEAKTVYKKALKGRDSAAGFDHQETVSCFEELVVLLEKGHNTKTCRGMFTERLSEGFRRNPEGVITESLGRYIEGYIKFLERLGWDAVRIFKELNAIAAPFGIVFKPPAGES